MVGPKKALAPPPSANIPIMPESTQIPKTTQRIPEERDLNSPPELPHLVVPSTSEENTLGAPLWKLLLKTYDVVNKTQPQVTESCWMCYDMQLPFYEGIALPGSFTLTSKVQDCCWEPVESGLSLEKGYCGKPTTLSAAFMQSDFPYTHPNDLSITIRKQLVGM